MLGKGATIASGVVQELDELRDLRDNGKAKLEGIRQREAEATGITSLKIAFNNVFGYYLEVRHAHKDKVPEDWIRKQTLTQAERYITPELKELEQRILGAEERLDVVEREAYSALVTALHPHLPLLQSTARAVAGLDLLLGFAEVAEDHGYTRPTLMEGHALEIVGGRHPVIERLPDGESYVANDVALDRDHQQILMITGPNMSGKSALLRQTALIALMAQMGSYVPARSVRMGLVDKVFTRVGASGQPQCRRIDLHGGDERDRVHPPQPVDRSLVLLDEIGRGTSTYDGISIAWAIAEFLHEHPKCRAKTLFATHYHELNRMADRFPRIHNANVSVRQQDGKVLFLRKLVPGGSEHKLRHPRRQTCGHAGLPRPPCRGGAGRPRIGGGGRGRAAGGPSEASGESAVETRQEDGLQMSFFQLDDPVLQDIKEDLLCLDIDQLTPVEALLKLHEIRKRVGG